MALNLRCQSCGRRYDFQKDEICPRCGAFNSPNEDQRQALEKQILQERIRRQDVPDCTPECMPEGYGGHSHTTRPRTAQRQSGSNQWQSAQAQKARRAQIARKERAENGGSKKGCGCAVVILILLFFWMLPMLLDALTMLFIDLGLY